MKVKTTELKRRGGPTTMRQLVSRLTNLLPKPTSISRPINPSLKAGNGSSQKQILTGLRLAAIFLELEVVEARTRAC